MSAAELRDPERDRDILVTPLSTTPSTGNAVNADLHLFCPAEAPASRWLKFDFLGLGQKQSSSVKAEPIQRTWIGQVTTSTLIVTLDVYVIGTRTQRRLIVTHVLPCMVCIVIAFGVTAARPESSTSPHIETVCAKDWEKLIKTRSSRSPDHLRASNKMTHHAKDLMLYCVPTPTTGTIQPRNRSINLCSDWFDAQISRQKHALGHRRKFQLKRQSEQSPNQTVDERKKNAPGFHQTISLSKLSSSFFMPSTLTLIRNVLYTSLIVLYESPAFSSPHPDPLITTRHLFKRGLANLERVATTDVSAMPELVEESSFPEPGSRIRSLLHCRETSQLKYRSDTSGLSPENMFMESWKARGLSVQDMLEHLKAAGLEYNWKVSPLKFEARRSKEAASQSALKLDEKGKKRWDWIARHAKKYTDTPDEVSEGKWEGFDREKDFMMGFLSSSDLQILRRNINYMLSRAWEPKEFEHVRGSEKWVIKRYAKQWKEKGFNFMDMKLLGVALGIQNDGVKPFSATNYDLLELRPRDEKMKKMISWYRNANMASLSSEDQAILDFNLAYVDSKPWWGEEEMQFWRDSKMPYEVLAKVGTLLELGSEKVIKESDSEKVREGIWNILVDFASKVDIEEPLENLKNVGQDQKVGQGQIIQQLYLTSQLGGFKEAKLKNNLKAVTLEDNPIWTTIKLETLDKGEKDVIARLIQVDLLLNGIHPSRAREFGKALRSNSLIRLITGGERAQLEVVELLPEGFGRRLDREILYPALKRWFQTRLKIKENRFQVALWKYSFALRLSRAYNSLSRFGIMIRRA
ncbi:hypothetical protein CROQUDRAFT_107499 [Cronartium quercuum f. sp. fusiforme G11]|uniref:Uncharacterized protein n=1 Tax=Cronartium quercuum f. sp. fusiforme G11 TaxID=708437 RepID=A0A9P6TCU0_9BASI|nr:hypothetical protein CROQUDRAFT_107499 [Cronartium quercuum f. sp. fusiforme G11]